MSRPMILAYSLTADRLNRLRFLCMKLGVLVKAVPAADFAQPIGALCGVSERVECPEVAEVPDVPVAPDAPVAPDVPVGEMIVFCHMSDVQVDRFLQTARQMRVPPFPIKAILTPTNAAWSAPQLYQELTQERQAIRQGAAVHGAEE